MVEIDQYSIDNILEMTSVYSGSGKLMSQSGSGGGSVVNTFNEQPMSTQDAAGVLAHWQHPGLQQQQPMTQEELIEHHNLQHHEFSERSGNDVFTGSDPTRPLYVISNFEFLGAL